MTDALWPTLDFSGVPVQQSKCHTTRYEPFISLLNPQSLALYLFHQSPRDLKVVYLLTHDLSFTQSNSLALIDDPSLTC